MNNKMGNDMNKYFKISIFTIITLTLSACANTTTYRATLNAPHAYIGYWKKRSFWVPVDAGIFDDYKTCKNTRNIPENSSVMTIDAGRPTSIIVSTIPGLFIIPINFVVTFVPEANYTYLINVNNYRGESELTILNRKIGSNENWQTTPFIKRDYELGIFSAKCVDTDIDNKIYGGNK